MIRISNFLLLFSILSLFSCTSNTDKKMDSSNKQQTALIRSEEYKNYIIFKTHSIEDDKTEIKDFIKLEQLDSIVSYKLYRTRDWHVIELSPEVNMLIYFNLVGVITAGSDYTLPCIGLSIHKEDRAKDYYIVYHSVVYPKDKHYENVYGYINGQGSFAVDTYDVPASLESPVLLDSTINLTLDTKSYLNKIGFDSDVLMHLDSLPGEKISI